LTRHRAHNIPAAGQSDRAKVDDLAVALGLHPRRDGASERGAGGGIDANLVLVFLKRKVLERLVDDERGVVDENVDAAVRLGEGAPWPRSQIVEVATTVLA
jgi:hypothetical protein